MKIGMITDSLPEADFDTMLGVAARLDMDMLEFACGNWSNAPHIHLDKLLDSAALAEVDRIRIIHGHGMGILKRAIADLLARHPHVEKFYVAPPEEGGAGATIVELKT